MTETAKTASECQMSKEERETSDTSIYQFANSPRIVESTFLRRSTRTRKAPDRYAPS